MDIAAGPKGQKSFEGQVRLVRGAADKFALKCRHPVVGEIAIGQRESPWMVAAGKSVLMGVKNPVENHIPLSLADPRHLAKLRILGGLIGSLDLAQSLLRFGLVDRMVLWVYPLLLGSGKHVFAAGTVPTALRLTESVTYPSGTLHLACETAGVPTYGTIGTEA